MRRTRHATVISLATGLLAFAVAAAGWLVDVGESPVLRPLGIGAAMSLGILAALQMASRFRQEEIGRRLIENERQLRSIIEASPLPITVTRLSDGALAYANEAAHALFKGSVAESTGLYAGTFYADPQERRRITRLLRRRGEVKGVEVVLKDMRGNRFWANLSVVNILFAGEPATLATMSDITDWKSRESELRHLATTDPLTGISNRRHFLETASREFMRSQRYGSPLSFILLDIDHFKNINDTFGHADGDEALRRLVAVCAEVIREVDTLGRLGGEEFGVILPETTVAAAAEVGERLRQTVETTGFDKTGRNIRFTVSLGVAGTCKGDKEFDDLLRRADNALYEAKRQGRNRCVIDCPAEP